MTANKQETPPERTQYLREQAAYNGESDGPTMAYPPKKKEVTALALYRLPGEEQ